ncbi:MAG TPA: TonB family protein [Paludibacteraceae bacterium]|nr:TonB family protein [Paludibacteraceae bacterium]HPT42363.1 TonB family protein [Paludibacteraceae bacterium]
MAKDVNLTSQEWIDLIFEGKNQDYGAYTLRKSSPKRHLLSFLGVAIVAVLIFTSASLINMINQNRKKESMTEVAQMSNISMKKAVVPKENIEKAFKAPPPPELKSSLKFTAPIIKKDEEVREENEVKSQEEITESKVAISVADVKGTNEETGVDIATLQEHKVIVAEEEPEKVFEVVEQPPSFPGGDAALMEYLNNNISYPTIAQENSIQGKVTCSFVVGKDGSIQDVRVERSVDASLDKEAVRVIRSMPKWIPGRQGGNAVKVKYYLPVSFRLQ